MTTNREIALYLNLDESTVSRALNGTYKGKPETIELIKRLSESDFNYFDELFKHDLFALMCYSVLNNIKASDVKGGNIENMISFTMICLTKHEQLVERLSITHNVNIIETFTMHGLQPYTTKELFIKDEFSLLCSIARKRASKGDTGGGFQIKDIRIYASICFEASYKFRSMLNLNQPEPHKNLTLAKVR